MECTLLAGDVKPLSAGPAGWPDQGEAQASPGRDGLAPASCRDILARQGGRHGLAGAVRRGDGQVRGYRPRGARPGDRQDLGPRLVSPLPVPHPRALVPLRDSSSRQPVPRRRRDPEDGHGHDAVSGEPAGRARPLRRRRRLVELRRVARLLHDPHLRGPRRRARFRDAVAGRALGREVPGGSAPQALRPHFVQPRGLALPRRRRRRPGLRTARVGRPGHFHGPAAHVRPGARRLLGGGSPPRALGDVQLRDAEPPQHDTRANRRRRDPRRRRPPHGLHAPVRLPRRHHARVLRRPPVDAARDDRRRLLPDCARTPWASATR